MDVLKSDRFGIETVFKIIKSLNGLLNNIVKIRPVEYGKEYRNIENNVKNL